jgi:hypothetical protein
MKRLLVLTFVFVPFLTFSQRLHLNLFGGFSNYEGDLQGKPFTLDQSNGAFGGGLSYDVTNHFSVRTGLVYGSIQADDKKNKPSLQPRNLNFKSKILEGNLLFEYNLLDMNYRKFTPYIFGGVAVYHFNPYSYDTSGHKIYLQQLSTEGQGLSVYPDRKPYKLTQFALPFGAGLKLRISDNVVMAYEIGLRKIFTDYLDDISTTYVDQAVLLAGKGPKAVEMAYRGGELKNGNPVYPLDGSIRGGAKYKDWYYFHGITVSIGLRSKFDVRGRANRTDCPDKVL